MCVLLLPFSWLYELATRIRNHMFDTGMLKSQTFPVPTICVGNITVGGTGKNAACGISGRAAGPCLQHRRRKSGIPAEDKRPCRCRFEYNGR